MNYLILCVPPASSPKDISVGCHQFPLCDSESPVALCCHFFYFEKTLQHLKALSSACFEGASIQTRWAQMGQRCFSFPWPNAQRWRNVVSCDMRLVHEAVFENVLCLETGRISTCMAATRSQQTPGSSWEKPGG